MSPAELNVVCKKCGSEVSPYVTECPYCGTRLRKRAPKIEKFGVSPEIKPAKAPKQRQTGFTMPDIRGDVLRPFVTIIFVAASLLVSLLWRTELYSPLDLAAISPIGNEYWRLFTASLVYENVGYEFICVVAIALFGWLVERRHGTVAAGLIIVAASVASYGGALAVDDQLAAIGGNGVALALIGIWIVPDLFALARKEETDSDMLGAFAALAVLLLVPLAASQASWQAGVAGLVFGLLVGFVSFAVGARRGS